MRVTWTASFGSLAKTLGVELFRVAPEGRMAVGRIGAEQNRRACRNDIATNRILSMRPPGKRPGWRIQPQRFLQHHTQIGQLSQISECWRSALKLRGNFISNTLGRRRMLRQQIPCPAQQARSVFMSRDQQ